MIRRDDILMQTFAKEVEWFETIDSTNTYAMQHAFPDDSLPRVIGANFQTRGRGRGAHSWWAQAGSLTFSIVVRPDHWSIPPARWPLISLATGLGICNALESHNCHTRMQLKWPNDVYANERKICGILLEAPADRPGQLVIGIGVNVNNSTKSAPPELLNKAISLCDLRGMECDLTEVLVSILNAINHELEAIGNWDSTLIYRFRERCFLSGRIITVRDATGEISGTCQGIDDDGALRLITERGLQRVFAGEVLF
ncbi:biotin--[acetyl-CoA-carboxylase] ligase [Planctomicrobium sp. SH527]|uniref:biotin--[acetyl-CoA-carboxylase] ligase n=1 Tax=Planctomicrobium sp. SH527 TaxID=3448123 RepID=UPI003F5B356A